MSITNLTKLDRTIFRGGTRPVFRYSGTGDPNQNSTGANTVYATAAAGLATTVTSTAHELSNTDLIKIEGTAAYNGIYNVTNVAANTFRIDRAFVTNEGAKGAWTIIPNLVDDVEYPIGTSYLDFGSNNEYHKTSTGVYTSAGLTIDLDGAVDTLVFDADGDTTMSAPTDDQIDIEIGGFDDFVFVANIFRALSGSVIETNTINETTGASGVTIDSVLIKDNTVTATDLTLTNDLLLASASIINWDSGDVTLTHSAAKLTFGGDGVVEIDFNNHEMTNVDIDSGAIDGAIIGAASAVAITGTVVAATTSIDIGATIAITGVLDEDSMVSDSAVSLATQQSIKAYVDTAVATVDTWDEIMHLGSSFTILDTENLSATITQNDTTNNPAALVIVNTGSGNDLTLPSASIKGGAIVAVSLNDGTVTLTSGTVTGTWVDLGSVTTVDINGGTVDGAVIGGAVAGAITGTAIIGTSLNDGTVTLTSGTVTGTWVDLGSVTTVDINGGTVDGAVIGGAVAAAITGTAIIGTSLNDGTVTLTSGTVTGTWVDLGTVTTVDIDGGTVDAAVIGGATPAAVTGTTIDATTDFTVGTLVLTDDTITTTATLTTAMATPTIGTGFDGAVVAAWAMKGNLGGVFVSELIIDLTDLVSSTTLNDIIGENGIANCHAGGITAAIHGTVSHVEVVCLETPAGGVDDIDFYASTSSAGVEDADVTALAGATLLFERTAAWANGDVFGFTTIPGASDFLYLSVGVAGTPGTYTAGKFKLTFYGA